VIAEVVDGLLGELACPVREEIVGGVGHRVLSARVDAAVDLILQHVELRPGLSRCVAEYYRAEPAPVGP
jgi:hypothetical protein